MRTQQHNWLDTNTNTILYGLNVSLDGKIWKPLAIDGKPYFATSEVDRENKRRELRRISPNDTSISIINGIIGVHSDT